MSVIVVDEKRVLVVKPPPARVVLVKPPTVHTVKVQPPPVIKVIEAPRTTVKVVQEVRKVIVKKTVSGSGGPSNVFIQEGTIPPAGAPDKYVIVDITDGDLSFWVEDGT